MKRYEWSQLVELGLKVDPQSRHASSSVRSFLVRKGLLDAEGVEVIFPDGTQHRYQPKGIRGGTYQRTGQRKSSKISGPPESYNVMTPHGVVNVTLTMELGFDEDAFKAAMASLQGIMGQVPPPVEAQIRKSCIKTKPVWIIRVTDPRIIEAWGIKLPGEEGK